MAAPTETNIESAKWGHDLFERAQKIESARMRRPRYRSDGKPRHRASRYRSARQPPRVFFLQRPVRFAPRVPLRSNPQTRKLDPVAPPFVPKATRVDDDEDTLVGSESEETVVDEMTDSHGWPLKKTKTYDHYVSEHGLKDSYEPIYADRRPYHAEAPSRNGRTRFQPYRRPPLRKTQPEPEADLIDLYDAGEENGTVKTRFVWHDAVVAKTGEGVRGAEPSPFATVTGKSWISTEEHDAASLWKQYEALRIDEELTYGTTIKGDLLS